MTGSPPFRGDGIMDVVGKIESSNGVRFEPFRVSKSCKEFVRDFFKSIPRLDGVRSKRISFRIKSATRVLEMNGSSGEERKSTSMFDVHLSDGDDMAKRVATRVRRFCTWNVVLNRSHKILLQHEKLF